MNYTAISSFIIKHQNITHVVDIACASLGIIPVVYSVYLEKYIMGLVATVSTIFAVTHMSSLYEDNDEITINVLSAFDAIGAVLVTLACTLYLGIQRRIVGIFRILWLVILITASCGYKFFASSIGQSYIPNDVSIIAVSISASLLILSALYMKCRRSNTNNDERYMYNYIPESILVCGALLIRFDSDLQKVIVISIGFSAWHICAWLAILSTLFIVSRR